MTLTQWLSAQNMKPATFAAKLGVSRQLVDRWLKRVHGPSRAKAIKVAKITDGAVGFEDWPARRKGRKPK